MKLKTGIPILVLITIVLLAACSGPKEKTVAPETKQYKPVSQELYDTIARLDSILFDALVRHDTSLLKNMFTKDLEFYHDKGGLTDYENMINVSQTLFTKENGLKRELVPGTLEVYPIKDYGAIQEAKHRFCHPENGKEDCGTFKFIHIWKREEGKWKISRVVSYDHN